MLSAAILLVVCITVLATMIPTWRVCRVEPCGVLRPSKENEDALRG
jgi:ABC-type lipoprotein release transport system permease subunit